MKSIALPLWLEIAIGVLLVLFVSNAITLVVAEQRRISSVNAERLKSLEDRLVAFVELYESLPDNDRGKLQSLASVRLEKLKIGSRPRVGILAERDVRVEERLRQKLFNTAATDIRVARRGKQGLNILEPLNARGSERFSISVDLGDGRFLNAEYYWPVGDSIVPGLLFSAAFSSVLLILFSAWLARRLASPFEALAEASDRMQSGKIVTPLRLRGPLSAQMAVQSFNRMAQRLMPLIDSQKTVLASVGHDLRTPLTSLRLKSEFIDDAELKREFADSLDELQSLSEAALRVAKGGVSDEEVRLVDFPALIESVCSDLESQSLNVCCHVGENFVVSCRPNEIKRAARNIIENAVKYGSCADVRVFRRGQFVSIQVDDQGAGISDEDLARAFHPFERLGQRSENGHGLGLTLAKAIARAHGGDVSLQNRASGGLRVILTIAA